LIRISVPANLHYRDVVIRAVAAACKLVGVDRAPSAAADDVGALDLGNAFDAAVVSAFAELMNNICLHGHRNGEQWDITIEIETLPGELVARITEHGEPFEVDDVPEPDLAALPEGGMGIHICRQVLDFVGYEPGPPNVWTLKKTYVAQRPQQSAATDD